MDNLIDKFPQLKPLFDCQSDGEIRDLMIKDGAKGKPKEADSCVIANWASDKTGASVYANCLSISVYGSHGGYYGQIFVNDIIGGFINNFDMGWYQVWN
jgi:hypothetical protein